MMQRKLALCLAAALPTTGYALGHDRGAPPRTAIAWPDDKVRLDPRYGPGIIDPRAVIESAP